MKLTKKIMKALILLFCGYLFKLSITRQLDVVNNIILIVGAAVMVSLIIIDEVNN